MFEFIKNLFKKEPLNRELVLDELEEWFEEETKEKIEAMKAEIKIFFTNIEDEKGKLKQNLETLKNAGLQNPNISVREKQIMEGNRFAYIKKIELFLEEVSIEKEKNVLEFCSSFGEAIERLNKSTIKPYYIVREFFSHYASDIAQNIKNLDKQVKSIREFMDRKDIKLIDDTKSSIARLKSRTKAEKDFLEQIGSYGARIKSLEEDKKEAEEKIKDAKNSREFTELAKLEEDYSELVEQIKRLKEPYFHNFYVIEPAMKKYERMSLEEETVGSYLDNPVKALKEDKELKILMILKNLKENIAKEQIELKDKKKEKVISKIEEFDEQYFKDFLSMYEELDGERAELKKVIESKTAKKVLKELNLNLEAVDGSIEKNRQELARLGAEREKLDLEGTKKTIIENLKSITGFDVKII